MVKEAEVNIDYEKLRKKLVFKEFITALITRTHGDLGNCVNAQDATPEQLIAIARRYNVNLDKYKIK